MSFKRNIAFPTIVLPKDEQKNIVQQERFGSSMLDHDLGHLCRGRRIHMSVHSDILDFSVISEHLSYSLECKQILRPLLIL